MKNWVKKEIVIEMRNIVLEERIIILIIKKKERMCFKPTSLYYSIEHEVYIPYFDGNKNVEAYLEWETKVDQIFEKHQLDEFNRFSMAALTF